MVVESEVARADSYTTACRSMAAYRLDLSGRMTRVLVEAKAVETHPSGTLRPIAVLSAASATFDSGLLVNFNVAITVDGVKRIVNKFYRSLCVFL